MTLKLIYSPEALADLEGILDYIAERGGCRRALAYVGRIEAACEAFTVFPRRGVPRDDVYPGLRTASMERRVLLTMLVDTEAVTIIRILYGGRDLRAAFPDDSPV